MLICGGMAGDVTPVDDLPLISARLTAYGWGIAD
jgi:hypothetical protein